MLPLANDLSSLRQLIPRLALCSGRAKLPNCFEFSNPFASIGSLLPSEDKMDLVWGG